MPFLVPKHIHVDTETLTATQSYSSCSLLSDHTLKKKSIEHKEDATVWYRDQIQFKKPSRRLS